MCGRYTIIAKAEEIEKRFNVEVPDFYHPRYNAAPTQILPVITNDSKGGLSFFHWGLIPQWAKNKSISSKLINARGETISEKTSFKNALKSRRCLVIADGYYEWKKSVKKTKIPYRIQLNSGNLFAMAGLWEKFEDEDQNTVHTFTIVTTPANSAVTHIHERMPAILEMEDEKVWLDDYQESSTHQELIKPISSESISFYSVSSQVNSVNNDHAALVNPAPTMDQHGNLTLFD